MELNLYKISEENVAPKASWTHIKYFLLAPDSEAVYQWINKNLEFGMWEDRSNDDGEIHLLYGDDGDDYTVIGKETFKQKMIRLGGELFDEDREYDDAYYGLSFFGWELIDQDGIDLATLKNLGLLKTCEASE